MENHIYYKTIFKLYKSLYGTLKESEAILIDQQSLPLKRVIVPLQMVFKYMHSPPREKSKPTSNFFFFFCSCNLLPYNSCCDVAQR